MFHGEFKSNVAAVAAGMTYSSLRESRSRLYEITSWVTTVRKDRLERSNDGSRSAGEGLCVLRSFLFTTQQEH